MQYQAASWIYRCIKYYNLHLLKFCVDSFVLVGSGECGNDCVDWSVLPHTDSDIVSREYRSVVIDVNDADGDVGGVKVA